MALGRGIQVIARYKPELTRPLEMRVPVERFKEVLFASVLKRIG